MAEIVHVRDNCRLCGSTRLALSLQLAEVPVVSPNVGTDSNDLTRVIAPLNNYLCENCGLNQLIHVVDPALIYRNYLYRTSISLGLGDHFRSLAERVISRLDLRPGDLVVEFGSNDGTLLSFFKEAGMRVVGVDPATAIAAEATERGIPTLPEFFGTKVAEDIRRQHGPAKAVLANNAMANIDDLDEIFRGVRVVLAPDAAFIFETQHALEVFRRTLLDVIYHEHISLFSVKPVAYGVARHELALFDAESIQTKGGSIRLWIQHANGPRAIEPNVAGKIAEEEREHLYDIEAHRAFNDRVARIRTALHAAIDPLKAKGETIAAYGTSVGCAALIHQFGLEDRLDVLYDDTPFKSRLSGPGYDLPVHGAQSVVEDRPALIVILAWRYAEPIISKHNRFVEGGGRFAIPLPELRFHPQ